LEELEKRHMLNMILGQLGTPASGIVSSKCDAWEGSAVTTTSRAAQVWSAGKGDLSLFSPPADSSSDVAVLLAGGGGQSATIATTSCTVHQNKTDTNATDSGSNAFWNNPPELAFPIANSPSLALRGGEDISMAVSASAKLAAASGSSSTGGSVAGTEGSVSRGLVAGGIASLASASPSQSAPMMLFPSAQGPGSVHTGSQKGLKGSLQIIPTFANGPNVFTGMVTLSLPAYVPVNADDDNGSGVTFGIPAKRDFDVSPLQVNDPELLPGTLEGVGLPAGGTWVVTSYSTGGTGQIRLWIDQKKTAPFCPGGLGPFGFDVEGAHESSAIGDVTVSATYIAPSGVSWNDTVSITVTPVINSFGVTVAGGDNGQNVNYTMGNDGSNGLWAKTPNGNASASFKGQQYP